MFDADSVAAVAVDVVDCVAHIAFVRVASLDIFLAIEQVEEDI
jgi:hypothetical protein